MESYVYKIIGIEEVGREFPFRTRYRLSDERLKESVARYGIRNPLVVTCDRVLVAGHKRLIAAGAGEIRKIPVLELPARPAPKKDLFFLALFSNWDRFASEIDKAWSIRRAKQDFLLDEETILQEILPILGLAPERGIYERYLKIAGLQPDLLDLAAAGELPFRGVQALLRFSAADQDIFACAIARKAALTANQLLQVSEWLSDLLKMNRTDLKSYLKNTELEKFLEHPSPDRRGKAEHFYQAVRALRFPQLAEREKKFEISLRRIEGRFEDLSVRAPSAFEEEGITLSAKVRNPESLARLVSKMQSQYPLFHSLFDVLG